MSSSGLIYAMIVGAWAAYLVPMWLRRQDELNEARPTERFSTAIRLLTGRGAAGGRNAGTDGDANPDAAPAAEGGAVDVRAAAVPVTDPRKAAPAAAAAPEPSADAPADPAPAAPAGAAVGDGAGAGEKAGASPSPSPSPSPSGPPARRQQAPAGERRARARVLARRRRTITLLFVALTGGAVAAAVGGPRNLWAAAVPAVLLAAYVIRVRTQERRRLTFTADAGRAEAAACRLREGRAAGTPGPPGAPGAQPRRREPAPAAERPADHDPHAADPVSSAPASSDPAAALADTELATTPYAADRRALVEQTDHAEWVDSQRERTRRSGDGWDPVPVPLPTYVTAPVAPRVTRGLDLDAPDTWSSARSSSAEPQPAPAPQPEPEPEPEPAQDGDAPRPRRSRERGRTPLFDQYADPDRRPRAANE